MAMKSADKIIPWEQLASWRESLRARGKRLVVTNGCFDLLHRGHVTYLESARGLGDTLLVGVNSDASVRELKGPDRPVNSEADRAAVLAALLSVDGVCVFTDRTALRFLSTARPDVYAKGGDYTIDTINQEERRLIEKLGGRVAILPGVPGQSTSGLLNKMSGNAFPARVTATLSVKNWARAFEFYKAAFGARELYRMEGGGVGQLSVAGAEFWVAEESPAHHNFSPESLGGCSVRMLLIVEDPAAVCARAIGAGAAQVMPVAEAHGWRLGRIVDPFGHHWEIGRPLSYEHPLA